MSSPAPDTAAGVIVLDVWRLRARHALAAAIATPRWNRRPDGTGSPDGHGVAGRGPSFTRLLGTGDARFTPRSADLTRWAALRAPARAGAAEPVIPDTPPWARGALAHFRARLLPLSTRGRWAGVAPFTPAGRAFAGGWSGEVLAVTRARLRPARAVSFWRAVPPVAGSTAHAPGLLAAMGVGEAPLGYQGTFSLWRDAASVAAFAWRDPAHRAVVDRTPRERWYAEELFARFAVLDRTASLDVWRDRTDRLPA